jgi:hypothetical protein
MFRILFDTFGIDIDFADVGWNYFLEKPIPQSKLHDLIICLAFFLDGRSIKVKDLTWSIWRRHFVYASVAQTFNFPFNVLTLLAMGRMTTTLSS